MKKIVVALFATLGLMAGLIAPASTAAAVTASASKGCLGETSIQKKPGVAPPFRWGKKTIHFGYAEWHNSPSCKDDMRRLWVKVYKVKKGKDPKVYSTRGETQYDKTFAKGTYRVKVRYQYRYWNKDSRSYGSWRNLTKTKTIRIR